MAGQKKPTIPTIINTDGIRKDNTPQNPSQTMGDSWCGYVHLKQ